MNSILSVFDVLKIQNTRLYFTSMALFALCNLIPMQAQNQTQTATFGAGCFWCVEAVFQELKGVSKVVSGYSGGHIKNPSYKEVCNETTGHAEVAQITFDPTVITYAELLEVFFTTHDPTTLNKQGNDSGTQYRSAIFYHTPEQKIIAEKAIQYVTSIALYDVPIVTEIVPLVHFYAAEDYHQNYYTLNANKNPYCSAIISPKVKKFREKFANKLK